MPPQADRAETRAFELPRVRQRPAEVAALRPLQRLFIAVATGATTELLQIECFAFLAQPHLAVCVYVDGVSFL
jgi:hypothetical protein